MCLMDNYLPRLRDVIMEAIRADEYTIISMGVFAIVDSMQVVYFIVYFMLFCADPIYIFLIVHVQQSQNGTIGGIAYSRDDSFGGTRNIQL